MEVSVYQSGKLAISFSVIIIIIQTTVFYLWKVDAWRTSYNLGTTENEILL